MAGTITAANLLLRIRDTLQDTTGVRWLDAELLRYMNDAQREIVNLRPEAAATTATSPNTDSESAPHITVSAPLIAPA